jgi:DNA-binding LacI/PurR family transcriptional regulator
MVTRKPPAPKPLRAHELSNSGRPSDTFSSVPPRVGIRDIAREARVSITTVSHALNGKGRLPEETRRRVREAAERLGYRANQQARGLALGRSMTLAVQIASGNAEVIVPDVAYFIELLNASSARALERGYGLVLAPPGVNSENVHQLDVDGAIVVDPTGAETMFADSSLPIVTTGRVPDRDTPWIDNDHAAGTRSVLEHLYAQHYHHPALLTRSTKQSYVLDALHTYETWCVQHSLGAVIGYVEGMPSEAVAAEAALRLLQGPNDVDAVFATLDTLAVGALLAARELGLRVPEDVGIAALTESPVLRTLQPSITALDLHPEVIGQHAVDLLVDLVEGNEPGSHSVIVPSTLISRESTWRFDDEAAVTTSDERDLPRSR